MSLFARLERFVGAAEVAPADPVRHAEPAEAPAAREPRLGQALARLHGKLTRHAASGDRHGRRGPPEVEATRLVTTSELREPLEVAMPGGHVVATEHGSTWIVDTVFEPEARHGDVSVGAALEAGYDHLEALTGDARLAGFDAREALFLDIEATGLEHGAGTLAFMIGLGFVHEDGFVVRQLVLREHEEERALLQILWDTLERHRFLVSFNGKSFDLSVLQNRLVMQRFCTARESELKLRPHLDLLHVGRGVFRGVWEDVRLQTLERRVLGFAREDDMPGSLAPLCWLQWLREGDARPLAGIARHNLFDVLSMLALAARLSETTHPRGDAGRPSAVALNLAQVYARRRCPTAALAVLEGLPVLADHAQRVAAHQLGATCARRAKDDAAWLHHLEAWLALAPDDEAAKKAHARLVKRLARVAQSGHRS